MASYEEIHGKRVETFSSDPTLDSSYEGQVWFNSTSGTLKTVVASAAWVSATPLSTSRQELNGAGTADSALAMGGYTTTTIANTEEFNGSGWSNAEDMPAVKHGAASGGLQTAAFIAGGYPDPAGNTATYEYDGTNWGSGGALSQARRGFTGSGTLTAGLAMGGFSDPVSSGAPLTNVEEYDGSSWTNGGALPAGNANLGAAGTQAATVAFGGYLGPPGNTTNAYHYDGSSWTSTGSMNTARSSLGGSGIQTSALAFGGAAPSASAATELYDGSTWTASSNMATARYSFGSAQNAPSNTTGLAFGGGPPHTAVVEDWNISINTITAGVWASSGSMNVARNKIAGAGIQTAALAFGSEAPPAAGTAGNKSESYNGTSWTETPTIQTNRDSLAGAGTQTAALAFGGDSQTGGAPSATPTGATEEFNGSSWSEQSDMSTARRLLAGSGTQTAALASTGYAPPSNTNAVEEYNGSSWTNGTGVSVARRVPAGGGTQTAGIIFGGYSTTTENKTEEYDGSSWTTGGVLNEARNSLFGMGLQTAALASGGAETAYVTSTEAYDGTAWSTRPNMATARGEGGSAINSTTTLGLVFGGTTGSDTGATEEFTGETTAVNASTLTTS